MVLIQCDVWYENSPNSGEKKSFRTFLAKRTLKTKLSSIFYQGNFNSEVSVFDKETSRFCLYPIGRVLSFGFLIEQMESAEKHIDNKNIERKRFSLGFKKVNSTNSGFLTDTNATLVISISPNQYKL